jgi:hypothetical protein
MTITTCRMMLAILMNQYGKDAKVREVIRRDK